MSAADFLQQVLLDECGAQHVVAGFDFVFGYGRGGDIAHLRNWLAPQEIGVTEVDPVPRRAWRINVVLAHARSAATG